MASLLAKQIFFSFVAFASMGIARAGDPDILSDFVVPEKFTSVDANFFTYTKLRGIFDAPTPTNSRATQATMAEFPALNGQGVSFSVLQLAPGGVSPPHTRPHATGLFFVLEGCFEVGFLDTSNKLFNQTLQAGDMFVFPKGLIHYQYNPDPKKPAMAIAAFGSANAEVVSTPAALFTTNINNEILAKSFKTDVATIQKIKNGLTAMV